MSGAITGALTTPLDVMKTRLMVQVDLGTALHRLNVTRGPFFWNHHLLYSFLCLQGPANQYNGFIDCAQTILREEGAGAFLKVKKPLHCACLEIFRLPLSPISGESIIIIGWRTTLNMHLHMLGRPAIRLISIILLSGYRAKSIVDRHWRIDLLRRTGENKVGSSREEQP